MHNCIQLKYLYAHTSAGQMNKNENIHTKCIIPGKKNMSQLLYKM